MRVSSHESTHTSADHLVKFYETFDAYRDKNYDGLIVTGAPVEHLDVTEVDYWDELCEIMDWSREHVFSTMYLCWGALAGLWHHYGIPKIALDEKLFGVYPHRVVHRSSILFRGFDDVFMAPHSRHTTIARDAIAAEPKLKILAESERAGVYAVSNDGGRQIFITGHSEYDPDTLDKEYRRDLAAGLPIHIPEHYFPGDDDTRPPLCSWRSGANLLFSNWLNSFVYQATPYDVETIPSFETNA